MKHPDHKAEVAALFHFYMTADEKTLDDLTDDLIDLDRRDHENGVYDRFYDCDVADYYAEKEPWL